LKCDGTR